MKRILRILRHLRLASLVALAGIAVSGECSDAQPIGQGTGRQADSLLADAIHKLERVPTLSAKIRQRVNVRGESLVGSGTYQQALYGGDYMFRTDLKIPLGGDKVSTLFQVCDGRFLWTSRRVPQVGEIGDATHVAEEPNAGPAGSGLRREMTRVDLNVVRGSGTSGVVAFGGLPHTLRQIARRYQFQSAESTQLQDLVVWKLTGQLFAAATEAPPEDGGDTGPPACVLLLLGGDDLFPYRIEFRDRLPTAERSDESIIVSARRSQSIAMDFFEVQFGAAIDARIFEFTTREPMVKDVTPEYIADLMD